MNYFEALQEIEKGVIRPVYLLYGEETFLIRQLKELLIRKLLPDTDRNTGLTLYTSDPDPGELVSAIETYPFFGSKNVIVIQETQLFKDNSRNADGKEEGGMEIASEEKSSPAVDRLIKVVGAMPEYTNVIFTISCKKVKKGYKEVSKRKKLFKAVEKNGGTVEVAPLSIKEIRPWITHRLSEFGKKASPESMEFLLSVLSIMPQISLGFLDNELTKMALYCHNDKEITKNKANEILSEVPEVSTFAMLEALSNKQVEKAVELLQNQISEGEHPLKILAMIMRQVRMLWQAKAVSEKGGNGKQVAEILNLPLFIGDKILKQSGGFSEKKLRKAILCLAEIDHGLKSGRADATTLLQFIIEFCSY